MTSLEDVANVALRVPAIVLLDLLYRWDVEELRGEFSHPSHNTSSVQSHLLWNVYYLAHAVCGVLVILPLRHLLNIYLYLLTALLLYVAHKTVRDYIRQEMDVVYSGTVFEDHTSLTRSVSTLTGLVMVSTLCSLLMRTRQAWLFSAPILPIIARLAGLPLRSLPLINTASTGATLLVMSYVALSGFRPLCRLFTKAYKELTQEMELYRLVALGMALWTQLAVPLIFLAFWVVLYLLQVYSAVSSKPGVLDQQGPIFILLNSVSECCGTPYCLLGLTFTVSYLALGMLNLCKFYLMGFAAFQNGNAMHRGVTEGVTLMLLSLQTGLLELQVLQRTFLLSIIFFIVVTSTLQSMIEIADPIVLALAATGNRNVWKHTRGLSLCLFLLLFPTYMAYKISYIFHMDFWLLILVSSCLLTSLQVLGTLFIYGLFMVELFQESQVERMDEIIYGVNAVSRVLEFLVAVCVVAYGTWESIFGEWSWMGVSVIIVHSYFNVWLRAQSGWKSFLLRREAANKISHLPRATEEELGAHNDVCSICFQEMSLAVITTCGHFFHAECLKKWLYVQDTCPLCHQPVRVVGRDDDEDDDEGVESDSDERGAGEHAEEDTPQKEETLETSQSGDNEEDRGIFDGEGPTDQETKNVPCRNMEEGGRILNWGSEKDHYKEEEVYMDKQKGEQHQLDVSCSKNDVLREKEGLHCIEEQKKEELSQMFYKEDQEKVRRSEQVVFRDEVCYGEEKQVMVPCRDETFYKEEQEVIPSVAYREAENVLRKGLQVLHKVAEDITYRKEEVHCGKESSEEEAVPRRSPVPVLYTKVEDVMVKEPSREDQEVIPSVAYREAEDVLRKGLQVLHREAEKVAEDILYRTEEVHYSGEEAVPCRSPVPVLYKEVEDVMVKDPSREDQEVIPSVAYREAEDVLRKGLQVLHREVEKEAEDISYRTEEVHYSGEEAVHTTRSPVPVLYKELEEVMVKDPSTEDQEVVPSVAYREAEDVLRKGLQDKMVKNPSTEDQEVAHSMEAVQVQNREAEESAEQNPYKMDVQEGPCEEKPQVDGPGSSQRD